jgi:hypothetical protein
LPLVVKYEEKKYKRYDTQPTQPKPKPSSAWWWGPVGQWGGTSPRGAKEGKKCEVGPMALFFEIL